MAFEGVTQNFSAVASADLSALQYTAVIFDTSGDIAAAASGKNCDGILQDAPKSGQAGNVAISGISKAVLGGSGATAGDQLEITTGGVFQTKSSGTAVAKALATGVSGDIISVLLYKGNAVYA